MFTFDPLESIRKEIVSKSDKKSVKMYIILEFKWYLSSYSEAENMRIDVI